jgi:hypothetical protein
MVSGTQAWEGRARGQWLILPRRHCRHVPEPPQKQDEQGT